MRLLINLFGFQVERTPTSSIHPSASHPQVVNKGISSASLVEGNDNNKSSGSDVDMNDDCKLVNDDVDCDVKTTYLETDVDKLDEIDTKKAESNTQPITEEIVQLSDMRSPSLGISRTPLLVRTITFTNYYNSRLWTSLKCQQWQAI